MPEETTAPAKPSAVEKPEAAAEPVRYDYDLIVIGSGPAGQRAAIQAAKLGKRVAVIERKAVVGGVSVNLGTIPSKTLREAVLYLSGYRERNLYGTSYTVKEKITIEDLLFRAQHVIRSEIDIVRSQLRRNNINLIAADARFQNPHTVHLNFVDSHSEETISGEKIIIATGSSATRVPGIPFDGQRILTSDDILHLDTIPRTMTIIGGGVIGCEYACMFATLGVRVTLVDKGERLLTFIDQEIIESLVYHLRQQRATVWLGEGVDHLEPVDDERGQRVRITLESGKQIITEKALYSIGRTGATEGLNLKAVGLKADKRGRLAVNKHYQTTVPHVYAVGDVIGFPSLASTSMEQGRLAACHAFQHGANSVPELSPFGIYTIPEISICGRSEQELTEQGVPYEIGKAYYRETARGQIIGDEIGMLKLIYHLETHKLLGVHIIGYGAAELIHIGQAVLAFGGTIEYFINNVFNYPTLAEAYKNAAFDAVNRQA